MLLGDKVEVLLRMGVWSERLKRSEWVCVLVCAVESPSVLVGSGSFLAPLVVGRMAVPTMALFLVLVVVLVEIGGVGNSELGMGASLLRITES